MVESATASDDGNSSAMTAPRSTALTRRRALAGAATVGIGVPVLVACSGDDGSTAVDPAGDAGSSSPTASASASSGGDALTTTEDIPVGSGVIFPDEQVVITQPTEGEFKCFTAVCTHQGCIVSKVADGQIQCGCHGSAFSIEDGSVENPPATQPLAEKQITVKGDNISLA
jgi:Rieske Fe-S protein